MDLSGLKDWTDMDEAMMLLGRQLGLFREEQDTWGKYKWIFASRNPLGSALCEILCRLCVVGILERNNDGDIRFARTTEQLYEFHTNPRQCPWCKERLAPYLVCECEENQAM